MFLSQLEGDIFLVLPGNTSSYNLTKNELLLMRGLAEDRSIIITPADKGSFVVVWDRADYLAEAENHLSDSSTYKEEKFGEEELVKLVEQSNMFKQPLSKKSIHCVKSVRIRSYSGPHFPVFGLRKNADQNSSEYGHFSRSDIL